MLVLSLGGAWTMISAKLMGIVLNVDGRRQVSPLQDCVITRVDQTNSSVTTVQPTAKSNTSAIWRLMYRIPIHQRYHRLYLLKYRPAMRTNSAQNPILAHFSERDIESCDY